MFTVGQRVRIISGGYAVEGLRDGDVVTVLRGSYSGYDCRALEGTPSFEDFPGGLYFLKSELVALENELSEQEVTTMDKGFYRVTEPSAFARIKNTLKDFEGLVYIKDLYPSYSPYEFYLGIGGNAYWEGSISPQHFEKVTAEEALSELGFEVGSVVHSAGSSRLWVINQIEDTSVYITGFQNSGGYKPNHVSSLKKASEEFLEKYQTGLENIKSGKTPYGVQINSDCSYRGLKEGEVTFTHKVEGTDYIYTLGGREIYWDSFNIMGTLNEPRFQLVWDDLDIEDKALNAWGLTKFSEVMSSATSEGVSDKFAKFLGKWVNKDQYHHLRMAVFEPKPSAKVAGNLAIFNNKAQKAKGIPVSMKVGRAIRLMFPDLDDKTLAQIVDDYRQEFPTFEYSVKESEEAWAFKHAYQHTMGPYENIYTTSGRKSLANSCMRHDFSRMKTHPCEVYASGDFRMYWTELPDGRIGSRCVVYINEGGKPQAGPIYGTTEASIDFLAEKLQEIGADFYENASWDGAKLLYVEDRSGIVGPYLDHEQSCDREGDYLVIGGDRYDACSYNGYISGGSYTTCEDCEADLDEDDYYADNGGTHYCEHCYNERYVECGHTHREILREDAVEVVAMYRGWGGNLQENTLLVSQDCIDDGTFMYCESREKYYESEYVVMLHDDTTEHQDDAGSCSETGDYYLHEDLKECQDGEHRNRFFLDEAGWVTDKDGLYYLPEVEEESEAA